MTTSRNHGTIAGTNLDQAREFYKQHWSEDFTEPMWSGEAMVKFAVAFAQSHPHTPSTDTENPTPTPLLSPFDAFQIMKLRRLLEAQSQYGNCGPVFMAEFAAVKDYLEFIGRGSVVPTLEKYEYERVKGAVLGPPGGPGLPDECLVCFAGRGRGNENC